MGQEVDTNGKLIPQGPEVDGFSSSIHGLPNETNPKRAFDMGDGYIRNNEAAIRVDIGQGGPVVDSGRGHQLEAKYKSLVGGEDVTNDTRNPRDTAPFESGQSASVSIGSAPGVEEGNPSL